jgi:hypothetical protein
MKLPHPKAYRTHPDGFGPQSSSASQAIATSADTIHNISAERAAIRQSFFRDMPFNSPYSTIHTAFPASSLTTMFASSPGQEAGPAPTSSVSEEPRTVKVEDLLVYHRANPPQKEREMADSLLQDLKDKHTVVGVQVVGKTDVWKGTIAELDIPHGMLALMLEGSRPGAEKPSIFFFQTIGRIFVVP